MPSIPGVVKVSLTGTLWGGGIIGGDPDPILLQSVKSLSSDGAGVGEGSLAVDCVL